MDTEDLKIKDLPRAKAISKESNFEFDELFFSITDAKSKITYTNDIFVRISKYNQEEIVGQLHKLIRHPDMPRSVFYEFWNHLKENRPVAAYVKNMAKDGSYYWVMALAFPCDGGYLSIRLKPGSKLFAEIKKLYKTILEHEKQQETLTDKKSAMLSSHEQMLRSLQELGFADYDEFMWNALQSEMTHREGIIGNNPGLNQAQKEYLPDELLELESILRELVMTLGDLKQLHENIDSHSQYILNLSRSVLLLSKNAQISSAKLDSQDRSLSVVAEKMGEQSTSGEKQLIEMQQTIFQLSELIGELNFDIISSKLQTEMTKFFLTEIEESANSSANQLISNEKALDLLYHAFIPKIKTVASGIGKLPDFMKKLKTGVRSIERFLLVLRFVHIKGKVEIARMNDQAKSFSNTFEELIKEVDAAEIRLEKLGDVIRKHESTSDQFAGYRGKLNDLSHKINRCHNTNEDLADLRNEKNAQKVVAA
ncbi:PAS domain-containing protein [Rhodohalobacter sp. SW132]|nr:PAS domain-containing protein [Rhodohalobacter sp. SW132]